MTKKVLIVDDSAALRQLVVRAFKAFDCDLFEAGNGVEGVMIATRERPDVILLDWQMPVMDGSETLARLRANATLRNIPVILLDADSGPSSGLQATRIGVRDCLAKPFREDQVVDRVGRLIDLNHRGQTQVAPRSSDAPITLLLVEDKTAIVEQVQKCVAEMNCRLESRPNSSQALEFCSTAPPDLIIVSLSLPDNAGVNFCRLIRASNLTKQLPVFGLGVRTGLEDQNQAQLAGFTDIIYKPLDLDDLKSRIAKTLNIDTSQRFFEQRDGALLVNVNPELTPAALSELSASIRPRLIEAVDAGIGRLVVDLGAASKLEGDFKTMAQSIAKLCRELSLKFCYVATEEVGKQCKATPGSKDWTFGASFEEALNALNAKDMAPA